MSETGKPTERKFRRRAEARPDEMLDAALELFIEKGFAATRVEDIARRAGISKGTVYLYFPSKDALLEGLVLRAIVPVADSALAAVAEHEGHPREIITLVLKALGARFSDPQVVAIPKIVLREAAGFPHLAEIYRKAVLDRALPAFVGLIRRGIEAGHLRPVDPELTLRSVIGPILAHVILAEVFGVLPREGIELDRLIDNHLSILFDGLSAR